MSHALITGASHGLGRSLAGALAERGWSLTIDGRNTGDLERAGDELRALTTVTTVAGDVADPGHRRALLDACEPRIDLLVNNASELGPSPLPPLTELGLSQLERILAVNLIAPLALVQLTLPRLPEGAVIVNVSSDAALEAYPGWGGYGASKAALDQLSAILGAEHPELRIYAVDPGDMRTRMHQQAFPGEDISDRPLPDESVPGLLELIVGGRPSGRYRARSSAPAGAVR